MYLSVRYLPSVFRQRDFFFKLRFNFALVLYFYSSYFFLFVYSIQFAYILDIYSHDFNISVALYISLRQSLIHFLELHIPRHHLSSLSPWNMKSLASITCRLLPLLYLHSMYTSSLSSALVVIISYFLILIIYSIRNMSHTHIVSTYPRTSKTMRGIINKDSKETATVMIRWEQRVNRMK